jgi:hypothetical protein
MPESADGAILKVLKEAMESRDVVDVAAETKQIASIYNVDAAEVARHLTDSGLLAGVNMAMGLETAPRSGTGAEITPEAFEIPPDPRPTTAS